MIWSVLLVYEGDLVRVIYGGIVFYMVELYGIYCGFILVILVKEKVLSLLNLVSLYGFL